MCMCVYLRQSACEYMTCLEGTQYIRVDLIKSNYLGVSMWKATANDECIMGEQSNPLSRYIVYIFIYIVLSSSCLKAVL